MIRFRVFVAALLAAAALLGQHTVASELQSHRVPSHLAIEDQLIHYEVEAKTVADLYQAVQQQRPDRNSQHFAALTESTFDFDFEFVPIPNGCVIQTNQIDVMVQTTLPRWRAHAPMEAKVGRAWSQLQTALIEHEAGHRRHVEHGVAELLKALAALPLTNDCHALKRLAERERKRVLLKISMRDDVYDRITQFGKTQGTHLKITKTVREPKQRTRFN